MGDKRQKPTAVSDLLSKGHGVLERLRRGSEQAQGALAAVREALPDGLGAHVWGAAVTGRDLTVLVASAAWATRVRYHAPGLKDLVAARLGIELDRVVVRVRPEAGPNRAADRAVRKG